MSTKRKAAEALIGSIRKTIDQAEERLFPGYFALVMATGIVSFFSPISYCFVLIVLLAWLIVFAGLLHRILRNLVVAR